MTGIQKRSAWTDTKMSCPSRVVKPYAYAAVHWPGMLGKLDLSDHDKCLKLMRTLEDNALRDGYGAFPYQVGVCEHRYIEGRTRARVNGANGDTATNLAGGSIVVLNAVRNAFTDNQKRHVLEAQKYLRAAKLVGHRDIRPDPTACPGTRIETWIKAGAPAPGDNQGDEDKMLDDYRRGTNAAQATFNKTGEVPDVDKTKPEHYKAGWNDVKWQVNHLRGRDGAKGDKGDQGPQGLPGASHSHAKVSVAGPPIMTP